MTPKVNCGSISFLITGAIKAPDNEPAKNVVHRRIDFVCLFSMLNLSLIARQNKTNGGAKGTATRIKLA